ncbi:MAG: SpoIIE family protein phosphatase, partial [Pseudomonadota bacterium]
VGNDERVAQLMSHLGFGGLIHAYKDYLIRHDEASFAEVKSSLLQAQELLNEMKRQVVNDKEAQRDIETVRETLVAYEGALRTIHQSHLDNTRVQDIDAAINIDNTPMLSAIDRIVGGINIDARLWFEISTSRIDTLKLTANRFAEGIVQKSFANADEASSALYYWLYVSFGVLAASLGIALLIAGHITSRIGSLNNALRYIIDSYDFSHRVKEGGDDEISFTNHEFNRLVGVLEYQNDEQNRQRSELQELVSDLEHKQSIIDKDEELAQQVFDRIIQAGGSDLSNIHSWNKPMTNFSGDLIVSAISDTGFTYIMMCDFTGHGLPAALGALPVSTVFYPMAKKDCAVSDIVMEVNDKLVTLLPTAYFCCASIMVLDRNRQSCIYWNGGLPPLLMYSDQGELKATLKGDHVPLGIMPYQLKDAIPHEIILEPGDSMYVYTDGLTEADNLAGEMYNETRLKNVLQYPSRGASRIPHVRQSVEKFIHGSPPSDDISIVEMVA